VPPAVPVHALRTAVAARFSRGLCPGLPHVRFAAVRPRPGTWTPRNRSSLLHRHSSGIRHRVRALFEIGIELTREGQRLLHAGSRDPHHLAWTGKRGYRTVKIAKWVAQLPPLVTGRFGPRLTLIRCGPRHRHRSSDQASKVSNLEGHESLQQVLGRGRRASGRLRVEELLRLLCYAVRRRGRLLHVRPGPESIPPGTQKPAVRWFEGDASYVGL